MKPLRSKDGQNLLGYYFQFEKALHFFGTRHGCIDQIRDLFPKIKFYSIQQVHGDHLVLASDQIQKADAQWTAAEAQGLLISTADCIPVLFSHAQFVCSIHAGWRGIKNEIVPKSLHYLKEKFGNLNDLRVSIGPHIQVESFEVDLDLGLQFEKQYQLYTKDPSQTCLKSHGLNKTKTYVDLRKILVSQLQTFELQDFSSLKLNTYSTPDFASYRRDKGLSERNLSFVARLNTL